MHTPLDKDELDKADAGVDKAIDNGDAEKLKEALADLVEKTKADRGAAFAAEVVEKLRNLKRLDRAAFEKLRAELKAAGCRVTALDKAISGDREESRRSTQADTLIGLAQEVELFHAPDSTGFADIQVNGHRETHPIRSKGFRRYLARRFYDETGGAPNSEAMLSALNVLEAKAHYDAPERTVHVRVGGYGGRIYLDLGDDTWRVVEISPDGWRIIDNPPVRFRRAAGMRALPEPVAGGSFKTLRRFINVARDADLTLVVAWLLACLRDRGPYPALGLTGPQGAAKSTTARMLRSLIDPNSAALRRCPRDERELFISASNGHLLAFDNISGLSDWLSDAFCTLSTGGGFAARQLHTDQDEILFDAERPIILNGIDDVVTRPDLADRSLLLTLEAIPDERRKPEAAIWREFEAERPRILGALLTAAAKGLEMLPATKLEKLPRMADFALWVTACEPALWKQGTFSRAYDVNRADAVESVIEADPVAAAVRDLMAESAQWTGTATELLVALKEIVGEHAVKSKSWPKAPHVLSGKLRRAETFLRTAGILIEKSQAKDKSRSITITKTALATEATNNDREQASEASPASLFNDYNSLDGNAPGTPSVGNSYRSVGTDEAAPLADAFDASSDALKIEASPRNSLKNKDSDTGDASDALIPPLSDPKNAHASQNASSTNGNGCVVDQMNGGRHVLHASDDIADASDDQIRLSSAPEKTSSDGLDIPTSLDRRVCAWCRCRADSRAPLREVGVDGQAILLHRHCEDKYLASLPPPPTATHKTKGPGARKPA
jgi:hypothetical protein